MCTTVTSDKETSEYNGAMESWKNVAFRFLQFLIVQFHCIFDCIVDFAYGYYYDGKAKKILPIKNELLLQSATSLATKIREKKITAKEVVETFIERCKEVNNVLNAIVEERFNEAIEDAKSVDELIKNHENPDVFKTTKPFLGVPFTTKESNEAKGLLHSMGLVSRQNHRSEEDATVIGYMKEAGAILVGKTNIPELNMWSESRNNVYGQTNNPYNTTRTVGGSSGGDGAIVAACGVPIAVGSDIGGSIRIPAFCNGVFGYKPTEGLTPMKGIGLRRDDYVSSMAEAGPISKLTEDLDPLLRILIGKNIAKVKLDAPVDIKKLNFFYQEGSGDLRASKVNPSMRQALLKVVRHFENVAASVTKIKLPGSEYSYKLWRYWMTQEKANFKHDLTNQTGEANIFSEFWKCITLKSEITLASLIHLINADILPRENAEWVENVTAKMKKYLVDKLGENGILLYPSAPSPAVHHYATYFKPFNFSYFGIFNVLRVPVCQVPLGLDENGLPLGIQVVAAPFNDHLCLAVARELEKAFGGWVPPSEIQK